MNSVFNALGITIVLFFGFVLFANRSIEATIDLNKVGETGKAGMEGFIYGTGGGGSKTILEAPPGSYYRYQPSTSGQTAGQAN